MGSIIRNVRDLEAHKRHSLEAVLGQRLQDNQQIVIRVLTPGSPPDGKSKAQALADLDVLCHKGSRHRESSGISVADADQVVDDVMERVRQRKSQQ